MLMYHEVEVLVAILTLTENDEPVLIDNVARETAMGKSTKPAIGRLAIKGYVNAGEETVSLTDKGIKAANNFL